MPNFSFFWRKHYNEIGNCCMTYPLEGLRHIDPDHAKAAEKYRDKQLVRDYIDIGWMYQKGLKWIGWDIQGWLAWTDPNGMLYRIKDLKRNEDGVAFEKEVNEVKSEQKPRTHMGNPSAQELYRYERDVQKECGFCPGDRRGSADPEVDKELGMDAKPKEEEIDLDDLMKGEISPFVPQDGYSPVTNDEEVTASAFVLYSPNGGYYEADDEGGGIVKEVIDPVGLLPPTPLPTPPPKQTVPGKRGLPDMPKGPTDTKPVTTPPKNPFKPQRPGNGNESPMPQRPSRPTPPARPNQNPYGPPTPPKGTAAIDNLRVYDPVPEQAKGIEPTSNDDQLADELTDLLTSTIAQLENADKDEEFEGSEKAKGNAKGGGSDNGNVGKLNSKLSKIGKAAGKIGNLQTAVDLVRKAGIKYQAKKERDSLEAAGDTESPRAKEAIRKTAEAHEELKDAVLKLYIETAINVVSAEALYVIYAAKTLLDYFENDPKFVEEEISNIDAELRKNPPYWKARQLLEEKRKLINKLNKLKGK